MKKCQVFMLLSVVLCCEGNRRPSISNDPLITKLEKSSFFEWMVKFNKTYNSTSLQDEALKNFVVNKRKINAHNKLFSLGLVTFTRVLWEHSDMSSSQKAKVFLGSKAPKLRSTLRGTTPEFIEGPDSVNWVKAGLVGPVEEQGWCGSCWAFAAKGIVESVLRLQNITTPVSAQQMVDCSTGNNGCVSGWPKTALDYLKTQGFTSEDEYQYMGVPGLCTFIPSLAIGTLNETFVNWTNGNETLLRDIVATVGPVSIIMRIEENFYNYESGIYTEPACGKEGNHCMLLVGYGTDPDQGDYWLVKNSWGESWGELGYARIARNRENMCNIAHSATWAI